MRYVEFAATSNFSFLRGASHPEELMAQAANLALDGLGLCDRNGVAGVVRAHVAKRESGLTLAYHPGARLVFSDGTPDVIAYPRDRAGWGRLTRLLTLGNRRAAKGDCILTCEDLLAHAEGLELIVMEASSLPSPRLRGEGGERAEARSAKAGEPGEGLFLKAHNCSNAPSPDPPALTLRRVDLSPQAGRGERERGGREQTVRGEREERACGEDVKHLLSRLRAAAPGRVRLAASMLYRGDDRARLAKLADMARQAQVPLIAVNDVLYHVPERRPLQDVLTCIREHLTLADAGRRLTVNAERHLKPAAEMARLFRDCPEAVNETLRLSEQLTFSLDELRYEYPDETRAGFATPQEALAHFTYEGAAKRYPNGIPDKVRKSLDYELALIASLNYAPYFLTVHDIVRFARSQGILCQGRGSAANSAVCFCLGVTEVDPDRIDLLFERFVSAERREPPDIDVDFEHERREEVIQYIYGKYGRTRAGLAATVISYRGRSAVREVGKAFALSEDTIGAVTSSIWGGGGSRLRDEDLRRAGLDARSGAVRKMLIMVGEIVCFPRHLSQHVGGFVITRGRLDEVVPIHNAAMQDRTCVEWDKDDLDALGILKIDVLGLGMLTCLRKALDLMKRHYPEALESQAQPHSLFTSPLEGEVDRQSDSEGGREGGMQQAPAQISTPLPNPPPQGGREQAVHAARENLTLAAIPAEDPAVYRMLQRADSLGVFQIESRAQMTMLPRLKPENFYDLVVEVAIVRPGPIQGDMVHPYLRRRQGLEPVSYPSEELKAVLGKTLGVPLFQEQAMKIAIVAGGFTPSEADKLRRAMATFRRVGTIGTFQHKMIEGMVRNGYDRDFAERCFHQIEGFGEYGFPESHAASFALLVYASAWLKCHYPDVFAAALLNAQPMGFYAPAQIVRDLREHGVEVRPPDVNFSDYDATLEPGPPAAARLHALHRDMADDIRTRQAIRLGLREIKGLKEEEARLIVERRTSSFFTSPLAGEVDQRRLAGVDREGGPQQAPAQVSTPLPIPPPQGGREESVASAEKELPYDSLRDLWLRTALTPRVIERLADADAFGSLGLTRRDALWAVKALARSGDHEDLPLFRAGASAAREPDVALAPMPPGEEVVNDYRFLKLSLRAHPASFLRADLARRHIAPNETLRSAQNGARVRISGLITVRQRPGTAKGVIFMTIEDETAVANVIVWPKLFERFRPVVLGARYVAVSGRMQAESGVIHVVADRLQDLTPLLARLADGGAEIDGLARCDEVRRPVDDDPRSIAARGGRKPPRAALIAEMPELAADLDVPARASRHVPAKRRRVG